MSAIGAGAKELPRQRGGLGRGFYRPSRSESGDGFRPVYSKVYTMAPIRGKGRKRVSQEAWPKGFGTLGHPLNRPETAIGGGVGLQGIIPGPRAPQRLAEGGGLSDWRKVVPALKQSRAEKLRVAARVVHGLREEIASSITTSLQTPAKPVLPQGISVVISPSRLTFSKVIPRYARAASLSDPNERTEPPPIEANDHVRVSLTQILAGRDTVPPGRKGRTLRTGRQSGLGRGHTLIGCVSVRPLCPLPLGSGFIVVRPRSFASESMGRGIASGYFVNYGSAKSSPCCSIALRQWRLSCGRLSGPG
jgi:hypothetical protein